MMIEEGSRIVIAGQEKIGKTTLVAGAPNAIFVPLEIGYRGIRIKKVDMIQDFETFLNMLHQFETYCSKGQFPYKCIVIDSLTALERLIHSYIVRSSGKNMTMETAFGGYGKAYVQATDMYSDVLNTFDRLAVRYGVTIVMTCHVFAAKTVDPQFGEYDSWDLLLHAFKDQKRYGKRELTRQMADLIGFLYEPFIVNETNGISKGTSSHRKGTRMLGVSTSPSYAAGNRFNLDDEIEIPKEKGWNTLAHAIYQNSGVDLYNREL